MIEDIKLETFHSTFRRESKGRHSRVLAASPFARLRNPPPHLGGYVIGPGNPPRYLGGYKCRASVRQVFGFPLEPRSNNFTSLGLLKYSSCASTGLAIQPRKAGALQMKILPNSRES